MIPETVNICGIPHKVILCEDKFDLDLHLGQITYANAEIRINKNASEEMQMQTLFHEMLHGIFMMIGRTSEAQDEVFVQSLATALFQSFSLRQEADDDKR